MRRRFACYVFKRPTNPHALQQEPAMIRHPRFTIAGAMTFMLVLAPAPVPAAGSDSAKGTLTVEKEKGTASVELAHAYLVSGPDTFDPKKVTRRIVFTKTDERATIEACNDVSCATLSSSDGMTVELGDDSAANWWAHVSPMQYSGMSEPGELKLSADTAERVAGTFKIGTSGVKTSVVFDAPLVKTFPIPHQ
jgi:hypothetical protein